MTKLSGVRHSKREFKTYSMALSLALSMLMLASTAASMQSTMPTRAQPDSRQAAAVVRWRSSRSNHAAASCELAPSMFTHVISPSNRGLEVCVPHHILGVTHVEPEPEQSIDQEPAGCKLGVVCAPAQNTVVAHIWIVKEDALLEQAHDAGPGMRASGVPIVRLQVISSDAMAKKLFQDLDRPAEEAVAAARAAEGDRHQLHAPMPTGRKSAQARTPPL